jgi:hypothetical protein
MNIPNAHGKHENFQQSHENWKALDYMSCKSFRSNEITNWSVSAVVNGETGMKVVSSFLTSRLISLCVSRAVILWLVVKYFETCSLVSCLWFVWSNLSSDLNSCDYFVWISQRLRVYLQPSHVWWFEGNFTETDLLNPSRNLSRCTLKLQILGWKFYFTESGTY